MLLAEADGCLVTYEKVQVQIAYKKFMQPIRNYLANVNYVDYNGFYFKSYVEENSIHGRSNEKGDMLCIFVAPCFRLSVRMIKSGRAGVGKTLKVHRLFENLVASVADRFDVKSSLVTISLHSRVTNDSEVLQSLLEHCSEPDEKVARIFHINVAPEVVLCLQL